MARLKQIEIFINNRITGFYGFLQKDLKEEGKQKYSDINHYCSKYEGGNTSLGIHNGDPNNNKNIGDILNGKLNGTETDHGKNGEYSKGHTHIYIRRSKH